MPGSFCGCEYPDSPWSNFPFQGLLCTFHTSRGGPTNFDVDEPVFRTIDRDYLLGFPYETPALETDFTIQCPGVGGGSVHTPKNNDDAEKWEFSGLTDPPDSSSPPSLGDDPSPIWTYPALPTSPRENVTTTHRLRDGGQLRAKALFNDANTFIFPTTTSMNRSSSYPLTSELQTQQVPSWADMATGLHGQVSHTNTFEGGSSTPACSGARGPLDEPLRAISASQVVANVHDICAVATQTTTAQTRNLDISDEIKGVSASAALGPVSRKRAIFSGPTILDLATSNELEPSWGSQGIEDDGHCDATTASSENKGNNNDSSTLPSRRVAIISVSMIENRLKRRGSSIDRPLKCKKLKLNRTMSRVSCAGDEDAEPKYQATEPASIRRARSLRSDISACSNPTDSVFYPSPLSSPTSRSCTDKDYVPTVPNTPLPNSVDYARSKANPLVRTLVVYERRSLNIPKIPSVPIIAPPQDLPLTVVRSSEDQAIDRLKALLRRERLERERDGLYIWDDKRTERLKATCAAAPAFLRRDSASTSDSSNSCGQWEEESALSATESLESQELVPVLPARQQLVSREIWPDTFGITNDFRKKITKWILEVLPKEPPPSEEPSGVQRRLGIDLYDELTNSPQTRFQAALLFHRYFLLADKVEFWRDMRKFEQESCQLHDNGVWDLAVACLALAVKFHRDCLPPFGPIFAAEFLDIAPHSMAHETFELAQRDILYSFQFYMGTCTPQDVLDELWNALPTLRKATAPIRGGWTVVQNVIWDKLFKSLLESDMLQYKSTLLTAAALINGLIFVLARHYRTGAEDAVCKCKSSPVPLVSDSISDDIEPTSSQIHHIEATKLVDDVILDIKDVLQLPQIELDECRKWLSRVDQD